MFKSAKPNWQNEVNSLLMAGQAAVRLRDYKGALERMADAVAVLSNRVTYLEEVNENYRGIALHASMRGRDTRGDDGQT